MLCKAGRSVVSTLHQPIHLNIGLAGWGRERRAYINFDSNRYFDGGRGGAGGDGEKLTVLPARFPVQTAVPVVFVGLGGGDAGLRGGGAGGGEDFLLLLLMVLLLFQSAPRHVTLGFPPKRAERDFLDIRLPLVRR